MRNILVLFGGVSTEHEVAIVTALQVMHALRGAGENVIPLYVTKQGEWVLGNESFLKPENYRDLNTLVSKGKRIVLPADSSLHLLTKGFFGFGAYDLNIDAIFPVFHGLHGEDGTIQGLLELANIPYVGCGVSASGVGIDKYLSKVIAKQLGINVTKDVLLTPQSWQDNKSELTKQIKALGSVVFVKPATLGSSIGITRVSKWDDLENAIEVAFMYSQRVLVEEGLNKPIEVNISIIGNDPYELSATEQPVSSSTVLSFEDKYLRQGSKTKGMASAQRLIPAPLEKQVISQIESSAQNFFRNIGGKGIARIDFMVVDNKIYFNEINTLPGSLAFYLWKASGMDFDKLVKKLVDLAISNWQAKQKRTTTFSSNILSKFATGGTKGKA